MKKRITIYDVAKEANVSLATVSRVINNSEAVKKSTRDAVLNAIKELNYVPNAVAQTLALKKSANIALVVPETKFSFIASVISGVVDIAQIYNYGVTLYSTNFGEFDIDKIIDRIIMSRVDGVIILNSEVTTKSLDQLQSYNIPVSVIGTKIKGKLRTGVYVDYEEIIMKLVNPYLEKQQNSIVFIDADYNRFIVEKMLMGLKNVYNQYGLNFKGHLKVTDSYEKSYEEIKAYLQDNKVDLFIASRDSLAIAALNAALDLDYHLPEDLEIIGFNNTKYSIMSRPKLSSVAVPVYEIGAIAARHITKMINDEELKKNNYKINAFLVHRETTKREME